MTPEQLLMLMRFQHYLASGELKKAEDTIEDFANEITPPPADRWVLRFVDTEGGYVGQIGRCESKSPKMLVWPTTESAQLYARHANIWKMVEVELIRG